jgi:outer membrane protein assembly factor BamA
MGGSTDVRGWALDHLGPYVYDPDASLDGESVAGQSQQSDDIIPVGGLVALHASAELRIYALNDYGLVLFTDVGNVWNEWSDMRDFTLLPSVGLGLRYVTPIGPLRVDVARRLDQEPMYALENRWALHISFSEAY